MAKPKSKEAGREEGNIKKDLFKGICRASSAILTENQYKRQSHYAITHLVVIEQHVGQMRG